jgi:dCMP deaminase
MIKILREEAEKSSDWWRQVGGLIVKDGSIISKTHNRHVPHEQTPYIDGDPRADFSKGVNLELSTAIHCEAFLIADAAHKGVSLLGAEMYVTTFPCPPCAKLIAYSGIKKLYYADGYGVLDGERILKNRGVDIIFVKTT